MRIKLLLKTLLTSTSSRNILKYETDSKKRKNVINELVGKGILYFFLMGYLIFTAYGYGYVGLTEQLPLLNAIVISVMVFIFALMKVNGYLFAFKDYDMLMSLPFSVREIVSSKFLYMYVKDLPWVMSVSVALEIGYGILEKPFFTTYILWTLLSLMLPIIPLIAATILGTLAAAIGSRFRFKKAFQSILIFAFLILCVGAGFFSDRIAQTAEMNEIITDASAALRPIATYYPPTAWFRDGVLYGDIPSILLLIGVSFVAFEITFLIVSRFYRQINSRLMTSATEKKYTMSHLKVKSAERSIAANEFRRLVHSTVYLTNIGFGVVMVVVLSVAALFVNIDQVIQSMFPGVPFTKEFLLPGIPLFVYFFVGMVSSGCCTPSLEGKSNWILQSLPLENRTIYRGKMLFNMLLFAPAGILGCLCLGIKFGGNFLCILALVLCEIALCAFSTAWGMVCGIKFRKLEWTNEIEVVKQGSAIAIYLFPNMLVTMLLLALFIGLGQLTGPILSNLVLALFASVLAFLCYRKVIRM